MFTVIAIERENLNNYLKGDSLPKCNQYFTEAYNNLMGCRQTCIAMQGICSTDMQYGFRHKLQKEQPESEKLLVILEMKDISGILAYEKADSILQSDVDFTLTDRIRNCRVNPSNKWSYCIIPRFSAEDIKGYIDISEYYYERNFESVLKKIAFYREHKSGDWTDDFYVTDLATMEEGVKLLQKSVENNWQGTALASVLEMLQDEERNSKEVSELLERN